MSDRPAAFNILVVDDEPGILALFEFVFAKADLQVLTAMNGDQAIALAEANRCLVAFVDMHLERGGSLPLIKKLSQIQPSMILVAMFCYPMDEILAEVEALGALRLHKPFNISEVLDIVAAKRRSCLGAASDL